MNTFRLNMCGDKRFSSDGDILDAFETIKAVGGMAQVHAESGDVIEREERAMIGRGITGMEDSLPSGLEKRIQFVGEKGNFPAKRSWFLQTDRQTD